MRKGEGMLGHEGKDECCPDWSREQCETKYIDMCESEAVEHCVDTVERQCEKEWVEECWQEDDKECRYMSSLIN